ncbi:MAG: GNAT family N-acetyltransferase [Proteobacteria bacterium]|nr:GNAT family N-acetyltransferase [Pseudomonadota bacterium]MBU1714660.1 GNAT family N-acetyltransferase [Pseudomonadota bacterium]
MQISQASIVDTQEILDLQKLAYQSEAELYDNYDIPPLTQKVEEINAQFKDHILLKAVLAGKIIGTVRAHEKNGTCYIGRLAVHPAHQNHGIGTALLKAIESNYSPQRFELFVGSKSAKNIHLYQKLGYTVYKTEKFGCGAIEIFYMEKTR